MKPPITYRHMWQGDYGVTKSLCGVAAMQLTSVDDRVTCPVCKQLMAEKQMLELLGGEQHG